MVAAWGHSRPGGWAAPPGCPSLQSTLSLTNTNIHTALSHHSPVNSQQTLLFRLCSHCDGGSTSLMFGGGGAEYGEEEEDYQYHNWGVDRVDLDFKSGQHRLQTTNKRNLFLTPTFSKWRCGEDLQVKTFIIFSLRSAVFVSGEAEGGTLLPAV